jgi:hypothetical protein
MKSNGLRFFVWTKGGGIVGRYTREDAQEVAEGYMKSGEKKAYVLEIHAECEVPTSPYSWTYYS